LLYLHELIRRAGEEVPVVDLVARVYGHASVHQPDLGATIDDQARNAYRRRLGELDEEIHEAEDWNDSGRLELLTGERQALLAELASATGLGHTPRVNGSTSERARTAVRKAIVGALARIEKADPRMARHLQDHLHTGYVCRYDLDPESRIEWMLDGQTPV
jgi:hypothetical protein